jgi:tRNA G18 (ribose-2'-O)-methylase SpoU
VYTGADEILSKITGFQLTRGVLCAMHRKQMPSLSEICIHAKRIAVLENITESTNVGAIFRSAAALNLDALLVTPECCDPLCRRAVRVSMGNVFLIPWTKIGAVSSDWPALGMKQLQSLGFKTAAMALSDNSVSIDDVRLCREEKIAILLGTEGQGLMTATISASDYVVRIPMRESVDSLNVAAAAAVAFWQLRH